MTAVLIALIVVLAVALAALSTGISAESRVQPPGARPRARITRGSCSRSPRTALSPRALDAALRLARAESATLVPVFLARVPLHLPLDAPLPRQSGVALPLQEAIEQRAAQFGVPVDARIERGRTYRHALRQTIAQRALRPDRDRRRHRTARPGLHRRRRRLAAGQRAGRDRGSAARPGRAAVGRDSAAVAADRTVARPPARRRLSRAVPCDVPPLHALAIFAAGIAAGTINTVVGSGTLITFPVLLAFGYPPVVANVSNTIGLVPGSSPARSATGGSSPASATARPGWRSPRSAAA